MDMQELRRWIACDEALPDELHCRQGSMSQSASKPGGARKSRLTLRLLVTAAAMVPAAAFSQSLSNTNDSTVDLTIATTAKPDFAYARPTQRTKVGNYLFEAYGPYPIVGAGVAAGINQLSNAPPEWHEGAEGFGKRYGTDFAIAAVATTTRFGLSEAFKEDALYYRCECRGVFPRLTHAVVSSLAARGGADGHRVFSFPALAAPYAGSFTAVYGWYPDRFGAKDAFRIGNYGLLSYVGGNIALEFLYSGPHSLFARFHLNNAHGDPAPGPNH